MTYEQKAANHLNLIKQEYDKNPTLFSTGFTVVYGLGALVNALLAIAEAVRNLRDVH